MAIELLVDPRPSSLRLAQVSFPSMIGSSIMPKWTDDVNASPLFKPGPNAQGTWLDYFTEAVLKRTRFGHSECSGNTWAQPQPGETLPPGAIPSVAGEGPHAPGTYAVCQQWPTTILGRDVRTFLQEKWAGPIQCLVQLGREPADDVLPMLFEVWFFGWDVVRRGPKTMQGCGRHWLVRLESTLVGRSRGIREQSPTVTVSQYGVFCWDPSTFSCRVRPL